MERTIGGAKTKLTINVLPLKVVTSNRDLLCVAQHKFRVPPEVSSSCRQVLSRPLAGAKLQPLPYPMRAASATEEKKPAVQLQLLEACTEFSVCASSRL